jgi:integrase
LARVLTTAALERYKPARKRRWIRDGGSRSLYLIIQPTGARSWGMRFRRPDGRPGKLILGSVDLSGRELKGDPEIGQSLSLVAARQLAASIHRERALGHDVVADHKARKHRRRAEIEEQAESTFGAVVRRYIKDHAAPSIRRWRSVAMYLGLRYSEDATEPEETRGGLAQRWADRSVRSIDSHDIHAVVEEARENAVPGVKPHNKGISEARARGLYAALSGAFNWMRQKRLIDINPCVGVFRPKPPKGRDHVLSNSEIHAFWNACDKVPKAYAAAARLLLLTGARLDEVSLMRPEELSADGSWTIPGQRTKNHRVHVIQLPALAREIIASAQPVDGSSFVFSTTGTTGLTSWSRIKHAIDAAMGSPPAWVLHDLRRTCATRMNEIGIPPHIVEACLNHVSGAKGGVAGIYNRAAYAPEKTAAFESWARFILLILDKDSYAAHERFLASGDRTKADKIFKNAVAEGGQAWTNYFAMIAADNVTPLPKRRRS